LSTLSMLSRILRKDSVLPVYLIYFVTERCNARCNHCYNWRFEQDESCELSLQEIERLCKNIGELYHVNFTGGEPFLRNDLYKVIKAFYDNCKLTSADITTNGYYSDKVHKIAKRLMEKCPQLNLQITVSLDHIRRQHDRIRRLPGLFENAVQSIMKLKDMKHPKLTVAVNLTLTKENEKDIVKVYSYIRDVIKPHMIYPILVRGNPRDPTTKEVSGESYDKLIALWMQDLRGKDFVGYQKRPFGFLLTARDIVTRKAISKAKKISNCSAGHLGGVIHSNGDVFPCELLPTTFGNIRDYHYDFKKIWFSQRAEGIRKSIKDKRCTCTHECFRNLTNICDMKIHPEILKEYIKLHL